MRKAESLGEDEDEIELILDGELALLKKEQKTENQKQLKSQKEGELIKCPSCGSIVPSFTTKCADCGHEFRRTEATHSVKQLFAELTNVETEERNRPRVQGFWNNFIDKTDIEKAIATRKATIISSFPISNSKEDILEFLSQAISKSDILTVSQMFNGYEWIKNNVVATAWNNKCKEIILKARFSMQDDKKTLEKIENYAKQLRIK